MADSCELTATTEPRNLDCAGGHRQAAGGGGAGDERGRGAEGGRQRRGLQMRGDRQRGIDPVDTHQVVSLFHA